MEWLQIYMIIKNVTFIVSGKFLLIFIAILDVDACNLGKIYGKLFIRLFLSFLRFLGFFQWEKKNLANLGTLISSISHSSAYLKILFYFIA